VRPCARPVYLQESVYNGHKRVHSLKFQTVVTPDGLIAHVFGPVEGVRHDASLLTQSRLLDTLEANPVFAGYSLYGDPAYPLTPFLLSPYKGANLSADQMRFNEVMSSVRVSVEWEFHDIINAWKYLDFKAALKIYLSPVGNYYLLGILLTNIRTCLNRKNQVSMFFDLDPLFCETTSMGSNVVLSLYFAWKNNPKAVDRREEETTRKEKRNRQMSFLLHGGGNQGHQVLDLRRQCLEVVVGRSVSLRFSALGLLLQYLQL